MVLSQWQWDSLRRVCTLVWCVASLCGGDTDFEFLIFGLVLELAAQTYFRKALDESERIWASHKTVIDVKGRSGVRGAIPKGFPYVYVDFSLGKKSTTLPRYHLQQLEPFNVPQLACVWERHYADFGHVEKVALLMCANMGNVRLVPLTNIAVL